jgi:hypothetical protein
MQQPSPAASTSASQPASGPDSASGPVARTTSPSAAQPTSPASPTIPVAAPLPLIAPPLTPVPNPDFSSMGVYQTSPVSADNASIFQRAADEPGLAVTVLPHAAHVSVNADGGDLSLHVRVRDGNADVNVSGSMAPMFESKAPEMRTVLGNQGLGLSSFATDQHGGGQHSQQRPDTTPAEPPSHAPAPIRRGPTSGDSTTADAGRIHITA